jgi:hypothetical protein
MVGQERPPCRRHARSALAAGSAALDWLSRRFRHRRGHDLRRTMVSLTREDGARKDILELCTHNPRKTGSSIDVYTTFPWEALCGEVAKLRIQRRTPGNVIELRAAVAATGAPDGEPPEPPAPEPPAPAPRSGRGTPALSRSFATPLARHAADSKGIRGDARWRRRESNLPRRISKNPSGARPWPVSPHGHRGIECRFRTSGVVSSRLAAQSHGTLTAP